LVVLVLLFPLSEREWWRLSGLVDPFEIGRSMVPAHEKKIKKRRGMRADGTGRKWRAKANANKSRLADD
jgi:hypothetical protein